MNVLFHLASSTVIPVLVIQASARPKGFKKMSLNAFMAFILGIISHGTLDYIPHCYPIPSKIDVTVGAVFIAFVLWKVKFSFKLIYFTAMIGCIFPDLLDLGPSIANDILGLNLPIFDKVFPWHFSEYSGSLYYQDCTVSMINHALLFVVIGIVLWYCRRDFFYHLGK